MKQIFHVTAPYFCSCVVFEGDTIVDGGPILNWMQDQNFTRIQVQSYCMKKRWGLVVTDAERPEPPQGILSPDTP